MKDEEVKDLNETEFMEAEDNSDKASPLAAQVKEYLDQQSAAAGESSGKKVLKTPRRESDGESVGDAPDAEDVTDEMEELDRLEKDGGRVTLGSDDTFEVNELAENPVYNIQVRVSEIPVTEEDQRMYLKSMLNDTPLKLNIDLYGGKMSILCRACSVYEQQLCAVASYRHTFLTKDPTIASILAPAFLQKVRAALQLVSCNGILVSDLAYSPEPNKFEEHAEELCVKAEKLVGGTNAARWNAYVYALNVFEHKLAKLNEMALNRDFLSPGD